MLKDGNKILRGQVYWIALDPAVGTEVNKTRPAVVVSNDIHNHSSPRVVVMPVTSNVQKVYHFEVVINIVGNSSKAMADQIRVVDKSRIGKFITTLTEDEMESIDIAIKTVLALK